MAGVQSEEEGESRVGEKGMTTEGISFPIRPKMLLRPAYWLSWRKYPGICPDPPIPPNPYTRILPTAVHSSIHPSQFTA